MEEEEKDEDEDEDEDEEEEEDEPRGVVPSASALPFPSTIPSTAQTEGER